MAELGSYIDNPQINNELCRVAAEVFGDCLRTKAGLDRKSTTTNPTLVRLYSSATNDNSFTEDQIKKFEDRLMVLLIRNYPYERRIKKYYELPDILFEAAEFESFNLTKQQLPNFIQMNVHGNTIQMLPFGECAQPFSIVYDNNLKVWS